MKEQEVKNYVGILQGDVWVNVDIEFKGMRPTTSIEEKLALDKVNSDFGVLAYEIKREIKEKIDRYFTTAPTSNKDV